MTFMVPISALSFSKQILEWSRRTSLSSTLKIQDVNDGAEVQNSWNYGFMQIGKRFRIGRLQRESGKTNDPIYRRLTQ
jgi:hypothetical protein